MKITALFILLVSALTILYSGQIILESGNRKTVHDINRIKDITFLVDAENNLIIEKKDGSKYYIDLSHVENFTISHAVKTSRDHQNKNTSLNMLTSYPNPFNPETTVSFELRKDGRTEIIVYNHLGQKIDELHSGILKGGKHSFKWNASAASIPSGVYFVQVSHENEISIAKMLLIK